MVLFNTGSGNKQRLNNISQLAGDLGQDKDMSLVALHVYSGCDSASAFCAICKLKPLKTILHSCECIKTLIRLGDSCDISDDIVEKLESLTCALYRYAARVTKVDDLRLLCINKICAKENAQIPSRNVDMASLPPCKKSVTQHI